MNQELISISGAARLTGITPHTIRAWETRYGAVKPLRGKQGGHKASPRRYSMELVERLSKLKNLVDSGVPISEVATKTDEQLDEIIAKFPSKYKDTNFNTKVKFQEAVTAIEKHLEMGFGLEHVIHELSKFHDKVTREEMWDILIPRVLKHFHCL